MTTRPLALLAAAGIAVLLQAAPARAAAIVGGSALLDAAGANQLETWLGQGPITLTNIFTKTPGATSQNFHAAADGQGPTFTVMRATANGVTSIIGGYNPQSWSSDAAYNYVTSLADRTAFIFNLTASVAFGQRDDFIGGYQTYNTASYGPTFGGGHDIWVSSNLISGFSNLYSYADGAPLFSSLVSLNNAGTAMSVAELEVFTIAAGAAVPVPEPFALALFGLGLAGLSLARRRHAA